MKRNTLSLVLVIFGLFLTLNVEATIRWGLSDGDPGCISGCSAGSSSPSGNSIGFRSNGENLQAKAFSTTGASNTTFQTATLGKYSGGLGVTNAYGNNGDSHTVDNGNGTPVDGVLFKFDQNMALNEVEIGYISSGQDSDISVYAYTGNGNADNSLIGNTFSEILTGGWELVGHYSNLVQNQARTINSLTAGMYDFVSSHWLVTAYAGSSWTNNNDFFKISGVGGELVSSSPSPGGSVPEPSSVFLLLLGLAGWKISAKQREKQYFLQIPVWADR